MKKLFTIVAVAMFALAMVSCASNVDKAKGLVDDFIEAIKAEDEAKVEEIAKEMEALDKELTEEERAEIDEYAESKMGELFGF